MSSLESQAIATEEVGLVIEMIANLTRGEQLILNKKSGDLFRDELAEALIAEGRVVRTEVTKATPFGPRRIDIEVWLNGELLGGIETKVGTSRYLSLQKIKDAYLYHVKKYPVELVIKPKNWTQP